ncbi:MAG TPA: hypothetical protein VJP59_09970 [Gemmatimonadota bacterium]|nr:hypothetical protein [Gemmatimonadota bacterium]
MRGSALALAIGWLALPGPVRSQDLDGARVIPPVSMAPAAYLAEGRDPFVPLIGIAEGEEGRAPRLDQLVLTGIFRGTPGNSLVVLEDPARRGHFLRAGESLGHARLLRILPDAAVFQVDDYGSVRQDTLRLEPDRAEPAPSAPAPAPAAEPEPAAEPSEEGS